MENLETYSYLPETNKLSHIETTPPIDFGYDDNGNIGSETGWTYVYDSSNQLIRVLQGSTQVAEYTYNGAGQRIKKVAGGVTTIFHHDPKGHLIAETNQSGTMLAEYVYLGDQLLAMIKPGESVYYFHNDHLGTPQVLTNDTGAIAWKAVYTPFGVAVPSIQTVENPFRFPGQYYDPESGLHYNYFRYYNPQTGRYMTPDPIGLEGGINLFVYVRGNPLRWIDPWGLQNRPLLTIPGPSGQPVPIVHSSESGKNTIGWPEKQTDKDSINKYLNLLAENVGDFLIGLLTAAASIEIIFTPEVLEEYFKQFFPQAEASPKPTEPCPKK